MSDAGWEVVANYSALHEAEFAAGRLESIGIPVRIDQGSSAGVFGAGFAMPFQGVGLLVPGDAFETAREALDLDSDEENQGEP